MSDLIARADKALEGVTPGPWVWSRNCQRLEGGLDGFDEVVAPGPVDCMPYCYGGTSVIEGDNPADAEFIAAARSLVPELRDRVVELEAEVVRLRELAKTKAEKRDADNRAVDAILAALDGSQQ